MENDFKDIMSKRTDDELIKIVTVDRDGYQPLALIAAEEEVNKRNLDTTKIENIKANLMVKRDEERAINANGVGSLVRLAHLVIDYFACLLIGMILSYMLGFLAVWAQIELTVMLVYVMLAAGFFGYYVLMETQYQKTIGKFITKTSVIMKDGGKPSIGDIVRRTLCRLIPFDAVSFLFTDKGFHDWLSGTRLIKDINVEETPSV